MNAIKTAKNFSMLEGQWETDALPTSTRDFRLQIRLPDYRAWQPGQFVMLRWGTHVIGRPFAIVDWHKMHPDSTTHESLLSLWVRRLGPGTEELFTEAQAGRSVQVTLPLGTGLAHLTDWGKVLFVSGGVGAASLYPIKKQRLAAGKGAADYWLHGEREVTALDRVWLAESTNLKASRFYFDAGTRGLEAEAQQLLDTYQLGKRIAKGFVTQAFEGTTGAEIDGGFDAVVACGPSAMLENLLPKLAARRDFVNVPVYLGLEEKMACGIGLCFSCSVSTTDGLQRCCLNGPWFEKSQLQNHFSFRKTGKLL